MRKPYEGDALTGNLTAMIDVVFQLIIFFVCTAKIQEGSVDDRIKLANAPNGPVASTKQANEITIDVGVLGDASIDHTPMSQGELRAFLKRQVAIDGQDVPIIIRGDKGTEHEKIKDVLLACGEAGVWKVQFAALREQGTR